MMKEQRGKRYCTTREEFFVESDCLIGEEAEDFLEATGEEFQVFEGFGAAFNELGMQALGELEEEERQRVCDRLFSPEGDLRLTFCRIPIGASDFALEWYSCNEHEDDFGMKHLSIERDRKYLLPYIKLALERNPDIKFFASPWSPPTWMKYPKAYNYGKLIFEKKYLEAYALYFAKFVEAYREEGVDIRQVHIQNEPIANQKFPSCLWTGAEYAEFIRILKPALEKRGLDTEVWFGTLNLPGPGYDSSYEEYVNAVLCRRDVRELLGGVAFQWDGRTGIDQTRQSYPELRYMQSENECGDGANTWEYAYYIFNLMRHYLQCGANYYIYWNMLLRTGGESTWGWRQNSLICTEGGRAVYNPEYYLMKHFSHFIGKGAVRQGVRGIYAGSATMFRNPDGSYVAVVFNGQHYERKMTVRAGGRSVTATLPPQSFNTFVF